MIMAFFQNWRPECIIESFYTTATQRKINSFSVDGFWSHCNTIFEALGCFYHFCECQEVQSCLTDEDIVRTQKKRKMDKLGRSYLPEKKLLYHWDVGMSVESSPVRESWDKVFCQINISLQTSSLLWELTFSHWEGRVVWLRTMLSKITRKLAIEIRIFSTDFQKYTRFTLKYWRLHKKNADENKLMTQPRRLLISSFHLINGTIVTLLLNFSLDLGLECVRIYRFVQYTQIKCFNGFFRSAVDAPRKRWWKSTLECSSWDYEAISE